MTFAGLNLSALVDLGFVLLVSGVCIRSLTSSPLDAEKIAQRWRTELQELERVLRQLISEASTASSNLDHRLMRRKFELETLLKRLETAKGTPQTSLERVAQKSSSAHRARVNPAPRENDWQLGGEEEFPNESWTSAESGADSSLGHLEDLVASAEDTLQIATKIGTQAARSSQPAQRTAPAQAKKSSQPSQPGKRSLAEQIEAVRSAEEEESEKEIEQTFKQLNIMDPTAYRIARRLLTSGVEIHVVARKLDLPVSEVRLLDRLMREEGGKSPEGSAHYRPTESIPARKIVRSEQKKKALPAPAAREQVSLASMVERELVPTQSTEMSERDIDAIIERELALL